MKPVLVLIYGPNGAGKTTVARALATKYRGLHIQIDLFSSMARGRFWHTRQNNKEKIALVLGILDAAMRETKYHCFFVDGVLIYRFMFDALEEWCLKRNVNFVPIYLTGEFTDLDYRLEQRRNLKKNWNESLPKFYKYFHYSQATEINSSQKSPKAVMKEIGKIIKKGGAS